MLSNTIVSVVLFVLLFFSCLLIYKENKVLAFLIVPFIDSAGIPSIPGLKFIDLGLIIWIIIIWKYKMKKIGLFTKMLSVVLIVQIIINLFVFFQGNYVGGIVSVFITPLHLYLPYIVFIYVLENLYKKIDFKIFFEKYLQLIMVLFTLMILALLLLPPNLVIKNISYTVPVAGFAAAVTPFILGTNFKKEFLGKNILIFTITIIMIYLSETRGALIIFALFMSVVLLLNFRKIISITMIIFTIVGLITSMALNILPGRFLSIINLYSKYLLGTFFTDNHVMLSGEKLRYDLWTNAYQIWLDHFWIGVGTNQFQNYFIPDGRNHGYSPHHSFLSYAIDGGIIIVILFYLPCLYILYKTFNERQKIGSKILLLFVLIYLISAVFLGYATLIYYLIFLYIIFNGINKEKILEENKI